MADLIMMFAEEFEQYVKRDGKTIQPFVFYLDARFSSIDLMRRLNKKARQSCSSSGAKPKSLWPFMKEGSEMREWRTLNLDRLDSTLTTVRAKKKAYVHLLSNHWSGEPITVEHHRVKPPRSTFTIHCPMVQKVYNMNKNQIDIFNSMTSSYQSSAKLNDEGEAYFKFFVQAVLVNAFVWWRAEFGAVVEQLRLFCRKAKRKSFNHFYYERAPSLYILLCLLLSFTPQIASTQGLSRADRQSVQDASRRNPAVALTFPGSSSQ